MKKALVFIMALICILSTMFVTASFAATSGGTDEQKIYVKTGESFFAPSITLRQEKATYDYRSATVWSWITGNYNKTKTTYGTYDIKVKNETKGTTETFRWHDASKKNELEKECEYTITVKYDGQATLNRNVLCQDGFTKAPSWKVTKESHGATCE